MGSVGDRPHPKLTGGESKGDWLFFSNLVSSYDVTMLMFHIMY